MTALEIEQALVALSKSPFDAEAFPFALLEAFGNKKTTIERLRVGDTNKSDLGGVLQTNNIHILACAPGAVEASLQALRDSPATTRAKAKFILATDGLDLEAEDLQSGDTIACVFSELPDHLGFFLSLAGIHAVHTAGESSFDIRATKRLNRLYLELLKTNPDWSIADHQHAMNHFMARLIFCFFAEDTDIFLDRGRFTQTVRQMTAQDASNTAEVITTLFRTMNLRREDRPATTPTWAKKFPYVNGALFAGDCAAPRFTKTARTYLLHVGSLDWAHVNPDIFGSMIQAIVDEKERGHLGMHYTSVPNILKVLNPLFLDDLRAQLHTAGDNKRALLNLRKRMARIRVFDPACGSGNFLVIAYKEMRDIEAEINRRRGEAERASSLPLTNFRGIELRDFSAEIARLSLVIAQYQCDVQHRGRRLALAEFLPLSHENWIVTGNALRLDWLSVCPPSGQDVHLMADDLFGIAPDQPQVDFANDGGETYLCGNPPYVGSKKQSTEQKADLAAVFEGRVKKWKILDYVAGWFLKAADYCQQPLTAAAFVSTNSICQGQQVPALWPEIFKTGNQIIFAHTSFKWANLAAYNAGVTVVIVGFSREIPKNRALFSVSDAGETIVRSVENINAYLIASENIEIGARTQPLSEVSVMQFGNHPYYAGALIFSQSEAQQMISTSPDIERFIRPLYGATEFINGAPRACLWIKDDEAAEALENPLIAQRVEAVQQARLAAKKDASAQKLALTPWRFREQLLAESHCLIMPRVSSENREYLPVGLLEPECVVQELAFALYDAPLWNLALIASRLHLVWIATICGKLETRYRYSNTLGWNTFPVPLLTEKMKRDLTQCAEEILLAREAHFPATIAQLYEAQAMPADLRAAHARNDEVVERIYIGRRFKNDSERLEKLFNMYRELTAS